MLNETQPVNKSSAFFLSVSVHAPNSHRSIAVSLGCQLPDSTTGFKRRKDREDMAALKYIHCFGPGTGCFDFKSRVNKHGTSYLYIALVSGFVVGVS